MRVGVLDIGSNTVHLLVVDAHRGAHPTPKTSEKTVLRLAERISAKGLLETEDADELVRTVGDSMAAARQAGCEEVMAFATSAIRDAANSTDVLARVREETGADLQVLSGVQEARLTFLAARRWFGWSAGRLLLLDIGGGSLEMAMGIDEQPDLAVSLPLGAGRVSRTRFEQDQPAQHEVKSARRWLEDELAPAAKRFAELGTPDRVVATSKTFRTLARLTGSAPSSAGPRVRRTLTEPGLRQLIAFISRMSAEDLSGLDGVSADRAPQLVGGALVAEATMSALGVDELDLCPWALREGVILRRLDHSNGEDMLAQQAGTGSGEPDAVQVSVGTGRNTRQGARWDQ